MFVLAAVILAGVALFMNYSDDGGASKILISDATSSHVEGEERAVQVVLKIANSGVPQKIVSVQSREATSAVFEGAQENYPLVLAANASASFSSDGVFILLQGVAGPLDDGRLIPIDIALEPAGTISTKVRFANQTLVDHSKHAGMAHMMVHSVQDDQAIPTLDAKVVHDPAQSSWSFNAKTENFQFLPEMADKEHVEGTGHGHIYLNGMKLGRYFGGGWDLGQLPTGKHQVRLSLNTNDHKTYQYDGEPIEAVVEVEVTE